MRAGAFGGRATNRYNRGASIRVQFAARGIRFGARRGPRASPGGTNLTRALSVMITGISRASFAFLPGHTDDDCHDSLIVTSMIDCAAGTNLAI